VKFRSKRLRLVGIAAIALALVVVVFYAEEDWRGRRAWQKCRQQISKNGDSLEMPLPPSIPNDKNFAASPIIAQLYSNFMDTNGNLLNQPWTNGLSMSLYHTNDSFAPFSYGPFYTNQTCWLLGKHVDLEWWQSYYRYGREIRRHCPSVRRNAALGQVARTVERELKTNLVAYDFPVPAEVGSAAVDVLFALGRYAPTIEEIRNAADRPSVRFPIHYDKNHPNELRVIGMRSLRGCLDVISLRGAAELQAGKTESAANDVLLGLRLTRYAIVPLYFSPRPTGSPFLTAILQPLWEGLADHKWSELQMIAFDSELEQMNFIDECQSDIKVHRARVLDLIEYAQRKSEQGFETSDNDCEPLTTWMWNEAFRVAPSGWYDQNRSEAVSLYQTLLERLDPPNVQMRPGDKVEQSQTQTVSWNPCHFLANILFAPSPDLSSYAYAQTEGNLARLACALERYRINNGEFPKTLNLLSPNFIAKVPNDITERGGFHYELKNGTNLLLYSEGWNGMHERGTAFVPFDGSGVLRGELAWRYK
jgi:hypothetical protein